MKKLILIPGLILILAFQYSFSQVKNSDNPQFRSSYWNISFSAGPTFNSIDRLNSDYKYNPGYGVDFELFYTLEDKKSAIVFCFGISKEQARSLDNTNYYKIGSTVKKELLFGPRFYIGKGFFVEGLIGNFLTRYNFKIDEGKSQISGLLDYEHVSAGIGGAIGAGKTFRLSDNLEADVKAQITFGLPELNTILKTSLNAGIIFNNEKIEKGNDVQDGNIWTVSLTGGVISPEFLHSTEYDIGANCGIEAALRKSSRVEVFCGLNYSKINEKYTSSSDRNIINFMFGPRFFFGSSNYLVFTEISTGFYIYDVGNDPIDALYLGGNFGPGIILSITKYVGFTAKSNIHIIFNHKNQPGSLLTASGGLRYEL